MNLVSWIVFGLVAGAIAKLIHPGRDPGGCLLTTALGIGGAFVGGYIGTLIGWGRVTGFDLRSVALAVLGAIVILILYRMMTGSRARRT